MTFILIILLSVVGALIGLHLITTLGISANTSVIGALVAMIIGRIGILGLSKFRDINRQNLAQSAISSATFAAANALLMPIGISWAFGRPDLVWPMLAGVTAGLMIDAWVLYRTFGSRFLPATAPWPPGVAAAETIKAGDQGGRRAAVLTGGGVVGAVMSWFGLSASAAGVAFIGNVVALLMLGIGLMVNQYYKLVPALKDVSLSGQYIPHGLMVGAGLVALGQAVWIFLNRPSRRKATPVDDGEDATDPALAPTRGRQELASGLGGGFVVFIVGALALGVITGLMAEMSIWQLIGWALFAAFAAFVHEIIVGLAAMHSGWFPAFAVTLIFLVLGLVAGLPDVPLVVLVGYCAATGPAFADMGYDLKAGWILRRVHSRHPGYRAYEMSGRRQQYYAAILGFAVALAAVMLLWQPMFTDGRVPPVSKVFADTITAGLTNPNAVTNLMLWAIPGAIIQLIGGSSRQMGIMLATGLLLTQPNACWLIFGALIIRLVIRHLKGAKAEEDLALVGAGLIAGDAIASLGQIFKPR
ncbi:OPT family oligopeptide transporter [Propioniciclava coleopterorum]|uniref:OPT family oligopeptide transporter n=1 Tax=Propioniciclava coleopterorum TaxID=2714937 RepID=A0A6G7YB16_9ACTN|nr:OPT family oligopeptide transporter [Propioniciclava coleopterorum]